MGEETKVCSKCGHELPLKSFYRDGGNRLRSDCKTCRSATTSAYQFAHPEQRREYTYRGLKKHLENPENVAKKDCRRRANYALVNGKIERRPCEVCGSVKSEMHHDDYDQPLKVRWMCHKHHGLYHRALREAEAENAALA